MRNIVFPQRLFDHLVELIGVLAQRTCGDEGLFVKMAVEGGLLMRVELHDVNIRFLLHAVRIVYAADESHLIS